MENKIILGLHQAGIGDIDKVGGKNASLGEMLQYLTKLGIRIPAGFIITIDAYHSFISNNRLAKKSMHTYRK